ncbi:MAG: TonB-dependent receptor plug domain-containing protein [Bacteroidales bacterium]
MPLNRSLLLFALALLQVSILQANDSVERFADIEEVTIMNNDRRRGTSEFIDLRPLGGMPTTTGSFETILKVLPGVHSSNELSSQYSVRGGSFHENLVYVNGIEIYRPMLTRAGHQEGLSFINPAIVSTVEFSTGGFSAEFGDKMSSMLNVKYKRPTSFGGNVEGSLLGASASCNIVGFKQKLSGAVAMRYKQSTYLIGGLETKGEYAPSFSDIQTTLTFDVNQRLSFNFLGSYGQNVFLFSPESRETSFGTLNSPQRFIVHYQGQEKDVTQNAIAGLTAHYKLPENIQLNLSASVTTMAEKETYDIEGAYWLRQTEVNPLADARFSTLDIGSSQSHARNYLNTAMYTVEQSGRWNHNAGNFKWGIKAQHYRVVDWVSQWQRLDSTGHSVGAQNNNLIINAQYLDTSINVTHYSAFAAETYNFEFSQGVLRLISGLRFSYSTASREFLMMPRVQTVFLPKNYKGLQIYSAVGAYHQPVFYKEMKTAAMDFNSRLKAQKAWHFTIGSSLLFQYQNIPCRLSTEAYYKLLYNLIPYEQDNVDLLYNWQHRGKGYATGVDVRLSAELIHNAESWISLSLMKASQDIIGDSYTQNGTTYYPEYFPMSNDQRFNISIMLQDKFLDFHQWLAHLTLNYGTSLPAFSPASNRNDQYFRMPSYFRTDIGFSYIVFDNKINNAIQRRLKGILERGVISVEALNLFNQKNISSYLWVRTAANNNQSRAMVAVPNYLTPFRLNVKLAITF